MGQPGFNSEKMNEFQFEKKNKSIHLKTCEHFSALFLIACIYDSFFCLLY